MPVNVYVFILLPLPVVTLYGLITSCRLQSSASLNNVDQHDDNSNYQQDVNQPSHRVTGHQPQHPQNYQYHSDRPQHMILLSVCFRSTAGLPHLAPAGNDPESIWTPRCSSGSTLFTPLMSLTSLLTRSFSAVFLALPPNVTTPCFVSTLVWSALVERWNSNATFT